MIEPVGEDSDDLTVTYSTPARTCCIVHNVVTRPVDLRASCLLLVLPDDQLVIVFELGRGRP